ncbi:MAG: DUF4136 domain-containing protein [Sphingomonadaceae bacterium]
MLPSRASLFTFAAVAALGLTGTALMARPGWGGPGWDEAGWDRAPRGQAPSLEGRIDVARFRAEDQRPLSGSLTVEAMPGEGGLADPRLGATFQAAVEDRLLHSGYVAAPGGATDGQVAEVRVVRSEAAPAEEKRKPLSGEMEMGVSNHGTILGLGLRYDATKRKRALRATRLEARIRDRASGAVLWEGRAEMYSREGDDKWDDQAIATRLAKALFEDFPGRTGEQTLKR